MSAQDRVSRKTFVYLEAGSENWKNVYLKSGSANSKKFVYLKSGLALS